ncbi:MAG: hypothetical protein E7415_04255 [Ruminococcaceae bacterium]|nr:hypothetical protein [Oscillospiraceae bacterium]
MKKTSIFLRLVIIAGVFIILGTAGASDLERLNLSEIFPYMLLGVSLIMFGRFGLMLVKARQTSIRRKIRRSKAITVNRTKIA